MLYSASEPADERRGHPSKPVRVLAIASGGGHWAQLLRMRPAWEGCDVAYATTHPGYDRDVRRNPYPSADREPRFYIFPDANLSRKVVLAYQLLIVAGILLQEWPHVVISTGASAGYFALRIGKLLRCRTIWVDSIANADELSVSGRKVAPFADLWLTQWPHLSRESDKKIKPKFYGAVV